MSRLIKIVLVLFIALLVISPMQELQAQAAWAPNTAYSVGTLVTYNGVTYKCLQAHTSLVGWEPPNVPALWSPQGTAPTNPPPTTAPTRTNTRVSATATRTNTPVGPTATRTRTNTPGGATATRVPATATRAPATATRAPATATRTNTPSGAGCFTAYVHGNVYTGGMTVSYNGRNWRAKWWTQNEFPSTGGSGVWEDLGACGGGTVPTNTPVSPTRTNTPQGATAVPTRTNTPTGPTLTPNPNGLPKRIIVGYWHNFDNGSGAIRLRDVVSAYNVINVSFAEPTSATSGDLRFAPFNATDAEFISDISFLKSQGRKVLISIGGANGQVRLDSTTARDNFVRTAGDIIAKYGFDGLDVDFEGHSLELNQGDTNPGAPTTPVIVNTISALRSLKTRFGANFMLGFAPETFFVQLGYTFYGGTCLSCDRRAGAYLPVLYAMRNDISFLYVQDYNSGSITALDNVAYGMGNADFHVAMTEMSLRGFTIAGTGFVFPGFPPEKIAIGVPATVNAGGGYVPPSTLQQAFNCLARTTNCGSYQLRNPSGYPNLRGFMTWSINWDRFDNFSFSNPIRSYLNSLP